MNAFSDASGLSLNIKKCVLLPIHSWPESSIASINVQTEVKYLCLTISKDVRRINTIYILRRLILRNVSSLADQRSHSIWKSYSI